MFFLSTFKSTKIATGALAASFKLTPYYNPKHLFIGLTIPIFHLLRAAYDLIALPLRLLAIPLYIVSLPVTWMFLPWMWAFNNLAEIADNVAGFIISSVTAILQLFIITPARVIDSLFIRGFLAESILYSSDEEEEINNFEIASMVYNIGPNG